MEGSIVLLLVIPIGYIRIKVCVEIDYCVEEYISQDEQSCICTSEHIGYICCYVLIKHIIIYGGYLCDDESRLYSLQKLCLA